MAALEIIQQKGWIQRRPASLDGVCISRALWLAYGTHEGYRRARAKVASVIKTPNLVAWNDKPGRTREEVLAVLQEARV